MLFYDIVGGSLLAVPIGIFISLILLAAWITLKTVKRSHVSSKMWMAFLLNCFSILIFIILTVFVSLRAIKYNIKL